MSSTWDAALYNAKHAFVSQMASGLVELLDPRPGERILDLGCGTGTLTARIAAAGAQVLGQDSSESMLAQARQSYPEIDFVLGDARTFALEHLQDAVFSNAVLHWVRPPEQAVACIAAALRPGGRFVAEFGGQHNCAAIIAAAQASPSWYYPSIGEYTGILEAHGFDVEAAWWFERPTPLNGDDGLRNWLRMFAAGLGEFDEDATVERARPALHRDGQWFADYRRIRVVARRR